MGTALRYGILGTGNIARQFATGLSTASRCTVTAVGSRSNDSGRSFADLFKVPRVGSYAALVADPDVDVVYNSLPNTLHHEWTIKALRAGKHVLCEKPFARNQAEATEMFDTARREGRLVMEGFMYRAHPLIKEVIAVAGSGVLGPLKHIRTSFCYRTTRLAGNIRFDPSLAGGALMDVGCYCLSLSLLVAKSFPTQVHAVAQLHESGVDASTSAVLQFGNDLTATFNCGMTLQADNTATISGQDAYLEIPVPWKPPETSTYMLARSTPPKQDLAQGTPQPPPREVRTVMTDRHLFAIEADDFAASIQDGRPLTISEADTLATMKLLDMIRAQVGLAF